MDWISDVRPCAREEKPSWCCCRRQCAFLLVASGGTTASRSAGSLASTPLRRALPPSHPPRNTRRRSLVGPNNDRGRATPGRARAHISVAMPHTGSQATACIPWEPPVPFRWVWVHWTTDSQPRNGQWPARGRGAAWAARRPAVFRRLFRFHPSSPGRHLPRPPLFRPTTRSSSGGPSASLPSSRLLSGRVIVFRRLLSPRLSRRKPQPSKCPHLPPCSTPSAPPPSAPSPSSAPASSSPSSSFASFLQSRHLEHPWSANRRPTFQDMNLGSGFGVWPSTSSSERSAPDLHTKSLGTVPFSLLEGLTTTRLVVACCRCLITSGLVGGGCRASVREVSRPSSVVVLSTAWQGARRSFLPSSANPPKRRHVRKYTGRDVSESNGQTGRTGTPPRLSCLGLPAARGRSPRPTCTCHPLYLLQETGSHSPSAGV